MTLATRAGGGEVIAAEIMTPLERVASTPKGQLKNPYPDFASVAEEGHRKYMAAGCHGGGGGGMAPPLTNPVWIYSDEDDTLFRLIALGTGTLSPGDAFGKLGYRRRGSENVVGPMPHFGEVIKTDDSYGRSSPDEVRVLRAASGRVLNPNLYFIPSKRHSSPTGLLEPSPPRNVACRLSLRFDEGNASKATGVERHVPPLPESVRSQ